MDALTDRARAGDAGALEDLLSRLAPSIQRFGLRMCRDPHDAEDVVQDTLLAVATHLGEFQGRASLSSWVFALARSACARRRRGLKNQPSTDLADVSEPHDEGPDPEQRTADGELAEALTAALDALPEDYRMAIQLRDVEDLSAPEAAAALGISVDALKSRLHRARSSLRTALRPVLEPTEHTQPGCPDVLDLWSRKVEGDLSAEDCAAMERHVAGCAACAGTCDALRWALAACRRSATSAVHPEVQAQVKAALQAWRANSRA